MFGETKWEYSLLICFLLISLLFTMLVPTCVTLHFGCKLRLPPRQFPGYTIRTKKRTFILNALIIISLSWSFQTLTCKLLHFL